MTIETARRASLEFVCVFGQDAILVDRAPWISISGSGARTSCARTGCLIMVGLFCPRNQGRNNQGSDAACNMPQLLGPIGDVPPVEVEVQYHEQAKVA